LLVFGVATVAGIWITGIAADRYLRPALLTALATIAAAMAALGLAGRQPAALLAAVALWGAAFGAAPTLLQTALIDAAGPARADVATALQTTVYNAGIAAGSLAGGLVLGRAGPAGLPWVTLAFGAAALGVVAVARRHGFPAARPGSGALTRRDQHARPLDEAGAGTINTYCR
jgi:predicted MFS family arabinose efflux permease